MTNEDRDNRIIEMHADIRVIRTAIERHDHVLYGNGQPGICQRLQTVEQVHGDCPARQAWRDGHTVAGRQGWWQLILSLCALAISGMAAIISIK